MPDQYTLVSVVLPHNTHLTEVMTVVNYLTSDADSDMESPHNSLLMLVWSSDCILSSKRPRAVMYTLPAAMQSGTHMTLKSTQLNNIHLREVVCFPCQYSVAVKAGAR